MTQRIDFECKAEDNLRVVLSEVMRLSDDSAAVVVWDGQCELAVILKNAYQRCLPGAKFVNFNQTQPAEILSQLNTLKPSDLAVLIQSTNFRLDAFRIRVELFNRSLKVIEHLHLSEMRDREIPAYIDSLAYEQAYYAHTGKALKRLVDQARAGSVDSGNGEELIFSSGFESAKLNIGDYSLMKNVGDKFPIGEVFTESKDLEAVNGRALIFAFGDMAFRVNKPDTPIRVMVEKGRVVSADDSTKEFDLVLSRIREEEGEVWVRELGFGLNRALTRERIVSDIGTYERMCGVHLSLGAKHSLYKKPNFTRRTAKYHVDVFVAADKVMLDRNIVYHGGAWRV